MRSTGSLCGSGRTQYPSAILRPFRQFILCEQGSQRYNISGSFILWMSLNSRLTRAVLPQSLFYRSLQPYTPTGGSLPAVFNVQDETLHKQIKTPIAPLFSLSNMTSTEDLVNDVIVVVQDRFDTRFAATGEVFDLGQWLQFFAFDVMGTMTFSKRYGFLDEGRDVGGMLAAIIQYMRSAAPVICLEMPQKLYKTR